MHNTGYNGKENGLKKFLNYREISVIERILQLVFLIIFTFFSLGQFSYQHLFKTHILHIQAQQNEV